MSIGPDPQIGTSSIRNEAFNTTYTRGQILIDAMKDLTVKTVLDIGAYTGETAEWFCRLFPKATIWSVEPVPESFVKLKSRGNPRVKPFHFAATNFEGTCTIFLNAAAHTNGLFPINSASRDSIDISTRREERLLNGLTLPENQDQVEVPARTLDSFVVENGLSQIDFLKIDVQGAETVVLQGSHDVLRNTRAILIEVSLYDYYTQQNSIGDVEEFLRPSGFELWSITDQSNNPMNGRTDWVELLYLNRQLSHAKS